jgi:hypothetical protein
VSPGYYSFGAAAAFPALAARNATRSAQALCRASWWCVAGIARECAAGRFGAADGEARAAWARFLNAEARHMPWGEAGEVAPEAGGDNVVELVRESEM